LPGNPKECRKHAARCRELADTAPNPEAREAFIELAVTWERLAAELEAAHVFLATLQELEAEVGATAEPAPP